MSLNPEIRLDWDRESQKFKGEELDVQTGIRTLWEKSTNSEGYQLIRRVDQFPDGLPERVISETPTTTVPTYLSVNYQEDGIRKSVRITKLGQRICNFDIEVSGQVAGRQTYFMGNYNEVGVFNGFRRMLQTVASVPDFISRSPQDNFRELAQIFKSRGKAALVDPDFMDEEYSDIGAEESIKMIVQDIDEKMAHWSPEERSRVEEQATGIMSDLVEMNLGDEFSEDEQVELISILALRFLKFIPIEFELMSPEQKASTSVKVVVQVLASFLRTYYEVVEYGGDSFAMFKIENQGNGLHLEIANQRSEPLLREDLQFGVPYVYEGYEYEVKKTQSGFNLRVSSIMNPDEMEQLECPARVDIKQINDLLSTPNNQGWERVIEVAKNRYSSAEYNII